MLASGYTECMGKKLNKSAKEKASVSLKDFMSMRQIFELSVETSASRQPST